MQSHKQIEKTISQRMPADENKMARKEAKASKQKERNVQRAIKRNWS